MSIKNRMVNTFREVVFLNIKHKVIISVAVLTILVCVLLYVLSIHTSKEVGNVVPSPSDKIELTIGGSEGLSIGDSEPSIGESEIMTVTTATTTAVTTTPTSTTAITTTNTITTTTPDPTPNYDEESNDYAVDYNEVERYALNDDDTYEEVYSDPDIRGWVCVPNTNINYPFTQADDNEYYLSHDIYGRSDGYGAIFMDWKNSFDDFGQQSDLLTLYGHNMADGSMFSNLKYYRDDYSFYDVNPIVEIYNAYSVDYYKIFAFLIVNGLGGSDFEFWKYNDLSDPDVFNSYVDTSRSKSLIDTAVDVQYGDKILSLVTCNSGSSSNNDRFMVVARKLRDDEDLYDGCYRIR